MNTNYVWYLEPLDVMTNELIGKNLPEENAHENILCEDGVRRNLWECEYAFTRRFASFNTGGKSVVKFKVFSRNGPRGKIRRWVFEKPNQKCAGKVVKGSSLQQPAVV